LFACRLCGALWIEKLFGTWHLFTLSPLPSIVYV
jgi:hypothetical protein